MHAVTHSLAHRAPPAARTRARWQPYSAIPIPGKSPYTATPASSISSTPPSSRSSENERFPLQSPPALQPRDPQKTRYIIGLVDQAVKCLCEIWQPNIIPQEFLISRTNVILGDSFESIGTSIPHASRFRLGLPSPISPMSQLSPTSPSHLIPTQCRNDAHVVAIPNNLVLKGFVHEVLRRSRTSGTVLQTALCYLEAIRSKVPELAQQEKLGHDARSDMDPASRIIKAEDYHTTSSSSNEIHMAFESLINIEKCLPTPMSLQDEVPVDYSETQKINEFENTTQHHDEVSAPARKSKSPSPPLPPLPPLPSPLLCPRRAFLASLILASKFTQDKCYSNRAWAKLAGLPPREIGRCERALGDALQWRLWVGKKTQTASSAALSTRSVVRCRSEDELLHVAKEPLPASWTFPGPPSSTLVGNRGLRRASTLPADAFRAHQPTGMAELGQRRSVDTTYLPRTASIFPGHLTPYPCSARFPETETPPTPTLTLDSPSSTESDSSVGDRTIQMTFLDACSPPNHYGKPFVGDKVSPGVAHSGTVPHVVGGDPILYGCHKMSYQNVAMSLAVAADSLVIDG